MVPYFSLLLPVYNVEEYLERCLESILQQDFHDYEIILIDDGTRDRSGMICDEYAQRYPFVHVIHKENGGIASARNAGLKAARGKYVWWIDSDDWIREDALMELYKNSCKDFPDVVKFNYYRVAGNEDAVYSIAQPGLYEGEEKVAFLLEQAMYAAGKFILSACTSIYNRELLTENAFSFASEREIGSEDYLFNLEVLLQAERVRVISEPLYYYELREGSITQQYKSDLSIRYTELYRRLKQFYNEKKAWERFETSISWFYVWHLMFGTCISHEYLALPPGTSLKDARRNVKRILEGDVFRSALKRCGRTAVSAKRRVLMWAMRKRLEPVFFWLFIVKPGLKGR